MAHLLVEVDVDSREPRLSGKVSKVLCQCIHHALKGPTILLVLAQIKDGNRERDGSHRWS